MPWRRLFFYTRAAIRGELIMEKKLLDKESKLFLLAFVEMWERFSYYGMRAFLVLYLTSTLGFEDIKAYAVYSLFAAIGYGVPIVSGIIADKLIGFQKTLIIGAIIMCIGHLSMVFSDMNELVIYLGLALIATGTGFFKGNITSLLGMIYKYEESFQRDRAFSLFNVAVNSGSLISSILCGYVAHRFGWHYGFALAGIGMAIGLIVFMKYKNILGEYGKNPNQSVEGVLSISPAMQSIFISMIISMIAIILLYNSEISLKYFSFIGLMVLALIVNILYKSTYYEVVKILALLGISLFFVGFISVEMQLGSLINLFTMRNVDRFILGYEVPAAILQGLNPLFVIIFGSLFANIFAKFGYESYMKRFAIGLFVNILCFIAIFLGCFNARDGQVNLIYIVVSMAFMSFGEICLFPMMQLLFTVLPPLRYKGFMMGVLLFVLSYANIASVILSKFMSIPKENANNAIISLAIYKDGFFTIMIFSMFLLISFLMVYPALNRAIQSESASSR